MEKKKVVYGHIGRDKDAFDEKEPERWRPTLSIFTHTDFPVHRFHLIHHPETEALAMSVKQEISELSKQTEVRLHSLPIRKIYDFEEVYESLYQFCKGQKFDTNQEDYYFHIITNTHVWRIGVFMVVNTNVFPGKILQTYSRKKGDTTKAYYTVVDLNLQRYDRIANRIKEEKRTNEKILKSNIDTKNIKYNELIRKIEQFAAISEKPILLLGKAGVGKTYLARRIFEVKRKAGLIDEKAGKLIEMDCTTIPESLLESELFGHKKGAFTGATVDYPGCIIEADNGLLFIDEIGNLSMYAQAKLLKVIEDRKVRPVGGKHTHIEESSFQLICATNKDLEKEIEAGNFREDLFARLNVKTFRLPELRERKEDIGPYIDDFWLAEKEKNDKKHIRFTFNRDAWDRYMDFAQSSEAIWKANFRDLNSSLERMCTEAEIKGNHYIDIEIVLEEIETLKEKWGGSAKHDPRVPMEMDRFDQVQLEYTLKICDESESMAAAGRKLYACSLSKKKSSNDSDRLKKYLSSFGLVWDRQRGVIMANDHRLPP